MPVVCPAKKIDVNMEVLLMPDQGLHYWRPWHINFGLAPC